MNALFAALVALCLVLPGNAFALDTAQLSKALTNTKLKRADDALKPFQAGTEKASFIVMLKETALKQGARSLRTATEKSSRAAQVKSTLDGFLSVKSAAPGFTVGRTFTYMPGFVAECTLDQLNALLAHDQVQSVEQNGILEPHLRQGIPLMNALNTRAAYNGSGLSIAICDTGVDYTNPYLGGGGFPNAKVLGGFDTGQNDADPMDQHGHGTACAGVSAGNPGDTGDYIGGVAYNAKIYALKISSTATGGSATDAAMIAAWEWCVTHQNDNPSYPIMVISTSFGGGRYDAACDGEVPAMTAAAANAVAAGITVFASSGNDGYCDSMGWPACISHVVSVGAVYDAGFGTYQPCVSALSCAPKQAGGCTSGFFATDNTAADMVTSYSNSASFLTLLAPSNRAYTLQCAALGSTFNTSFGGTSAACPYSAGAAAALQSAAKAKLKHFLTPAQVKALLIATGKPVTDSKVAMTKPRVNLGAAISRLSPTTAPAVYKLLN